LPIAISANSRASTHKAMKNTHAPTTSRDTSPSVSVLMTLGSRGAHAHRGPLGSVMGVMSSADDLDPLSVLDFSLTTTLHSHPNQNIGPSCLCVFDAHHTATCNERVVPTPPTGPKWNQCGQCMSTSRLPHDCPCLTVSRSPFPLPVPTPNPLQPCPADAPSHNMK
jgi:hypothetical protein